MPASAASSTIPFNTLYHEELLDDSQLKPWFPFPITSIQEIHLTPLLLNNYPLKLTPLLHHGKE
jgi:hypothetical protein